MADMLVQLRDLPCCDEEELTLRKDGFIIRNIQPWERFLLEKFAAQHFSQNWADEVMMAFSHQPVTCWIATWASPRQIVGMAAYECTRKNFFGPMGVREDVRGKGIGRVLLIRALEGLKSLGYEYAIIGGVGPASFYEKLVGATVIPNSEPGIYRDMLPRIGEGPDDASPEE
jgi:GNAT superfamily N-acetyltransferase